MLVVTTAEGPSDVCNLGFRPHMIKALPVRFVVGGRIRGDSDTIIRGPVVISLTTTRCMRRMLRFL